MERKVYCQSLRLISLLFLILSFSIAKAIPTKIQPFEENPLSGLMNSVNSWQLTEELKLVVKDLQSNKRDRAKLRLGKYLSKHKNEPRALNLAGLILLEEGKYEAASESFKRILQQGIKTSETYALAGVSAYMRGLDAIAKTHLKKAISLDSKQVLALRYLALIESSRQNYDDAIKYYNKILTTPNYQSKPISKVHINLADALVRAGDSKQAINLLTNKATGDNLRLEKAVVLASAYAHNKQLKKALSTLRAVKRIKPLLIETEEVRIERQFGDLKRAISINNKLIAKYPNARSRLYFDKGSLLAQGLQYADAAEATLTATEFATPKEFTYIERAAAGYYSLAGKHKLAEHTLKKALEREPNNIDVKYQLAELISKTRNINESEKLLDEILADNNNHFKAHYLKGVYAWNRQQILNAFIHFNNSININPQFIDGWLALSEVEHERSNDAAAQSTLEKGLTNNPNNPDLSYQLASIAFSENSFDKTIFLLKDFPESSRLYGDAQSLTILASLELNYKTNEILKVIEKSKKVTPNNLYLQDAEGYFLALNGETTKAIQILTKAAQFAENDSMIYLHLSEAYLLDKQLKEARFALKKATLIGLSNNNEKMLAKKIKARL